MFGFLFRKIFGSKNERYLRRLRPLVARINALEPEMQESDKWNSFPLPEELEKVVYGKTEGNVTTGPYIVDAFDDMRIPEITKGYYYFKDRHSESTDLYDSSPILERHSFNFTILLYDCDTDLLYIIEEDT